MSKTDGTHVYDPTRAVDTTIAFVEDQIANPVIGIKALIPGITDRLDPWKQGDLVGILAYTSNGKTSFVAYVINQHAHQIRSYRDHHPDYNHIIVLFSWEQPIEQMIGVDLSRVTGISVSDILYGKINPTQLKMMKESGEIRKTLPIWLVGHSIHDKRERPLLSMAEVSAVLSWIEDECGMVIDLVVLDYLQRIRYVGSDRVEGFVKVCDDARTLAIHQPTLLLAQAKRECFERPKWNMPILSDCQWSSNFEQSCTHIHALWRPWQNKMKKITVNGVTYDPVKENMLLHTVLKQTLGPINFVTMYEFGFGGTYLRLWGESEPGFGGG